jgi:DNA-binding HxlR family transcriptional regulator
MPRLSDKVLTERLRALEEHGLVRRAEVSGDRIYVVCELTERGDSLRAVLDALYAWGEAGAPDLDVKLELSGSQGLL